jgi:hypothetical protein
MTEPWTTIAGAGACIMTGGGGGAGGGGGGGGAPTLGKEKNDRFCAVTTTLPPAEDSSMVRGAAKPSASQSAADGSRSAGDATFAKVVGGAEAAISAAMAVMLTMDRKRLLSPM